MSHSHDVTFADHTSLPSSPKRPPNKIYFTETPKSDSDTEKSDTTSKSEKIHHTNRDTEYTADKSKSWTFLESLADSYNNNRTYFLVGFFFAVGWTLLVISHDPEDRLGVNKFVYEHSPQPREMDRPLGYERMMEQQRKEKPELYEA